MRLIGAFFLLPIGLWAQSFEIREYYPADQKQVKEVFYVSDTTTRTLDGRYTSYYINGKVESTGFYREDTATGLWHYFFETGEPKYEGYIKKGVQHGPWRFYYENGNLSKEGAMWEGKPYGRWRYYYENGKLKNTGSYDQKGLAEGLWNYFYEDGKLKTQAMFKEGSGHFQEFYPSGKLKAEGHKKDGLKDSTWIYLYETGLRRAEGHYRQGKQEGPWKYYFPNGTLSAEGNYKNGTTDGKWTYYHENGTLSSEGAERHGQKEGYWKLFYSNGLLKGETVFEDGNGEYHEYYENGQIKTEGYLKEEKRHGNWLYYYEDGHLEGRAVFNEGKGDYVGYYRDGSLKMKGQMEQETNIGIWELYNEDGSLAGYYRPYYENDQPLFQSMLDGTLATGPNLKPEYRYRQKRWRYFTPKINEFKGFILAANPLAMPFGQLPLSGEWYTWDRLGHELQFIYINNPFFVSQSDLDLGRLATRGLALTFRQKFYHPEGELGMYYFGHELQVQHETHAVNVPDGLGQRRTLQAQENRVEYLLTLGTRWVQNATSPGFTLDIYFSLGLGYRHFALSQPEGRASFASLGQSPLHVPWRLGFNIGYVFGKKTSFKLWPDQ
ncbi:MAG: membrane-binding protein [Cytophagales bacterium]|nr:membrane-binding protein [Cytophagales bacterium]